MAAAVRIIELAFHGSWPLPRTYPLSSKPVPSPSDFFEPGFPVERVKTVVAPRSIVVLLQPKNAI